MLKIFPLIGSIRQRLRKIPFLVMLYNYFVLKLPRDINKPKNLVQSTQDSILNQLLIRNVKFKIVLILNDDNDANFLSLSKKTVDSVLSQSYQSWLLIVPNTLYAEIREMDDRVIALPDIRFDDDVYIGEVYAGDCLHVHALKAFAHDINTETDLIYCDHNISTTGNNTPQYKPKWNKELAYSTFYTEYLTLYRLDLFVSLQHWLDFKSHYQRTLYIREEGKGLAKHIAFTLYHQANLSRNFTDESDLSALNVHLAKQGAFAEKGLISGSYKVNWPLPKEPPLVSIIIPTKNAKALVKQCIDTLYNKTKYSNFEVLLVDNQSNESDAINYFNLLADQQKVRLLQYDQPFNYSAINNFAVEHAKGELLVLMNNDIEVISPDWLNEMVTQLLRLNIGCIGAKLYYPNDTIQHAGVILGLGGGAGHGHKHYQRADNGYMQRLKLVQNYGAVTAACLGIRKSVYNEVNGLNETDLAVAYNDVDLCLKVKAAGYDNIWSPYIELYHHESVSRASDHALKEHQRYYSEVEYMRKKWELDKYIDPVYSPWLTRVYEDFSNAYPIYFYVNR